MSDVGKEQVKTIEHGHNNLIRIGLGGHHRKNDLVGNKLSKYFLNNHEHV